MKKDQPAMLKAENQSECVCCEESLAVKEIMTI